MKWQAVWSDQRRMKSCGTVGWLVVEEDALDQWPAGPGEVVGRPTPRIPTGPQRARGEARYTADVQLPGMLHTAVLRFPRARVRA